MKFRLKHWSRDIAMSIIGWIRLRLPPGSNLDLDLAEKYSELLNAQMADRRKSGKKEIQCYVEWGQSYGED